MLMTRRQRTLHKKLGMELPKLIHETRLKLLLELAYAHAPVGQCSLDLRSSDSFGGFRA